MIISRTPYRISFFGGGTDYPDWYLKNGGSVPALELQQSVVSEGCVRHESRLTDVGVWGKGVVVRGVIVSRVGSLFVT